MNPLKREAHERANLEAAKIILDDPERYAGVMVAWARLVLDREKKPPGTVVHDNTRVH